MNTDTVADTTYPGGNETVDETATADVSEASDSEFESTGEVIMPGGLRRVAIGKYRRDGGGSGKRICFTRRCAGRYTLARFRIGGEDCCSPCAKRWAKKIPGTGLAGSIKTVRR